MSAPEEELILDELTHANITVVVPTYWGRSNAEGWREADLVFDHPTPLDGEDTLGRLLDSLKILKDRDYKLVIIVVPTAAELEDGAVDSVRRIVDRSAPPVEPALFTPSSFEKIAARLGSEAETYGEFLNLSGYSNVRNACLIAARLSKANIAVLIDDDELFERPDFLEQVRAGFAGEHNGSRVEALAGYYINRDGNYLSGAVDPDWAEVWPKHRIMNKAFERYISRPPRYKQCPFAFGGNLALGQSLYSSQPFDTLVTRGEDLDYVFMAMMSGVPTILDNELGIRHLPPAKSHPLWQQVRQDAIRFSYQRAKIKAQSKHGAEGLTPVTPADLDPYPGFFLREDLEEKIEVTCKALAEHYCRIGDPQGELEALKSIDLARAAGEPAQDPIQRSRDNKTMWKRLMLLLEDDRFGDVFERV